MTFTFEELKVHVGVGESVQKNLSLILLRKGECICAM